MLKKLNGRELNLVLATQRVPSYSAEELRAIHEHLVGSNYQVFHSTEHEGCGHIARGFRWRNGDTESDELSFTEAEAWLDAYAYHVAAYPHDRAAFENDNEFFPFSLRCYWNSDRDIEGSQGRTIFISGKALSYYRRLGADPARQDAIAWLAADFAIGHWFRLGNDDFWPCITYQQICDAERIVQAAPFMPCTIAA